MEDEKVFYSLFVNKKTSLQIKEYAQFLNAKNKFRQKRLPIITEEDIIKSAIDHLFVFIETYYDFVEDEKTENLKLELKAKIKNRLREITMEQGLDQSAISKLTGIEPANISRVFNNRNQPSIDYFFRLWIALERPPIDDIFYADDN